jgi:DNA-binding response OmpR family regulator
MKMMSEKKPNRSSGSGIAVITSVDGDDDAKFVENKDRINLVVLDMVMPGKTGMRVYQRSKATARNQAIL